MFQEKLGGFPRGGVEGFPKATAEKARPSAAGFRVRSLEFCCTSGVAISGSYRDPCRKYRDETSEETRGRPGRRPRLPLDSSPVEEAGEATVPAG